ncbi:MAG TPA: glycosyltransferase family 2 protein [Kiritimatiellia bacterium]|nr:glycosyltransferase family 2 protein [Kiritimatiellia bacterium]HMO98685.1 glycosyltransferase family 2 protein [Kiritimatiellia bacterium]
MNPQRKAQPDVGLIVPCYNEEEVLPQLLDRLSRITADWPYPVYVLFVNDGSRDRTQEILDAACVANPAFACVQFSRNFGHQAAVTAGLVHAKGDVIAVIDADLQDPPEFILTMIEKWREGYDVVYGIRTNRKESGLLRLAYATFYRMLKKMANVDLPLDAGDFSLMDRRVVDRINALPEHNRFIRGLRGWVGFKQIGLPYEREARQAGAPKYNMRRLVNLALDGLISFSSVPLRIAAWVGALASLLGFVLMVFSIVGGLFYGRTPTGWTSLAVMLLFFGGIQLIVLGIIGEYVGRIFDEVKNRPHYVVNARTGWAGNSDDPA